MICRLLRVVEGWTYFMGWLLFRIARCWRLMAIVAITFRVLRIVVVMIDWVCRVLLLTPRSTLNW